MALAAALLLAPACNRAGRAAEQVQDACIEVLQPFTRGQVPEEDRFRDAASKAAAAARTDRRWQPVRDRLDELGAALTRGGDVSTEVDAVAEACRRANDEIKDRLRAAAPP